MKQEEFEAQLASILSDTYKNIYDKYLGFDELTVMRPLRQAVQNAADSWIEFAVKRKALIEQARIVDGSNVTNPTVLQRIIARAKTKVGESSWTTVYVMNPSEPSRPPGFRHEYLTEREGVPYWRHHVSLSFSSHVPIGDYLETKTNAELALLEAYGCSHEPAPVTQ